MLLGLDVGTTSAKAAVFALDGTVLSEATERCRVERPREGWVEQDPEEIWRAAVAAARGALSAVDEGSIAGVGVCGHSPTLILIDRAGVPCRPAIVWQDRRAAVEAAEIAELVPVEQQSTILGGRLPYGPSFPHPRLLWLRRHDPAVLERAWRALDTKDWINFRLTGEACSDPWSAKGLAHLESGAPIAAWATLLGVDPAIAPPTLRPSAPAGRVGASAARALGLAVGTPVAVGWTDGGCAMLGTGCFATPGVGFDSAGTSEVVGLTVPPRLAPGDGRLLVAPGPDPAWTLLMGPTQAGGGSLTWAEAALGLSPAEIGAAARRSAAGAEGVLFLPYLEGERAPIWDPAARGVLFGLSSQHGAAEIARAVYEGVAHSIRQVVEVLEQSTGQAVDELRVCGGGSRDPFWNQLKASLVGRRLRTTATPDTSALGAAMLAGAAAGTFSSIAEACVMVKLGASYEPEPAVSGLYDRAHRTYAALYPALRPLFASPSRGLE